MHSRCGYRSAERLSRQRPFYAEPLNICIEVNIDDEAGKSGVMAQDTLQLAEAVAELPRLKLRGLMCIPAIHDCVEKQRQPFARLRELADNLHASGIDTDTLSMGMTGDFVAAIQEGATIVRIGTALFGPRRK